MEKDDIEKIIKDTALMVSQSTKKENSGLIGDITKNVTVLQEHYKDIKITLDKIDIQTTNLRLWRAWITGGLGIIVLIVLPLLVYIFGTQVSSVEAKIKAIQDERQINAKETARK